MIDKEKILDALDDFNKHCKDYFQVNSQFKARKLPASYGYPMRAFYGVSARAFKKMFNCGVDEALKHTSEVTT